MQKDSVIKAISEGNLDIPKKELKEMGAALAKSMADSGFVSCSKNFAQARQLKEFIDAYLGGLKDYVLEELEHEELGKVHHGLVHIERANSGDRIDYIKDVVYEDLHGLLKKREELLKMAKKSSAIMVDELTGEQIPSLPLKTVGKTIVKATLK